ncbi:MAG: hypothetical protein U1E53_07165 [Dongiaceae bacterium]
MSNTTERVELSGQPGFRVGDQLARSFSLLGRQFPILMLIALPLAVLSAALNGALQAAATAGGGSAIALIILEIVIAVAIYSLCEAMVVYVAVQAMRGRRVRLGETLGASLPRVIPVLLLTILSTILIGLASLLLLIPGLMVLTMTFVAEPACVAERRGPIASISRSAELTRGYRWQVFGLILLIMILQGIVGAVIGYALRGVGGLPAQIVNAVWNALTLAFGSVACAVVYHDLRVIKEGVDIEQIAAVFG